MSIFTHTQAPVPDDCIFKISPSQISSFFEYPSVWYKSEVLNETQFHGNTSSVLGTCIHYVAEQYALGRITGNMPTPDEINSTITTDLRALDNPDVDKSVVLDLYRDMSNTLIEEYLSANVPTEVETSMYAKVADGIYTAGTIDAIHGSTIVDYKSASSKPNTNSLPWNYYIQLMAYAYMRRAAGHIVDRLRIVYVVRPTKTLPVRTFVVNHAIQPSDWQAIEDVFSIISESIHYVAEHPETVHLLFKSMSLKGLDCPLHA